MGAVRFVELCGPTRRCAQAFSFMPAPSGSFPTATASVP